MDVLLPLIGKIGTIVIKTSTNSISFVPQLHYTINEGNGKAHFPLLLNSLVGLVKASPISFWRFCMLLTRFTAENALREAEAANPGPWADHARYVAQACENIALRCPHLDADDAYIYGILHDIGRYAGVTSEKHLIDGYRYCQERDWEKAAQICISHAFMVKDISSSIGVFDMPQEDKDFMKQFVKDVVYDDYDLLVQLCDALALPSGFCLLEKRFVDVAIRYGTHPATIDRWKAVLAIKAHFEEIIGCSIYDLLPGVVENSFR